MATFVLDGKASAELPRRPIAVTLIVAGSVGIGDGARPVAPGCWHRGRRADRPGGPAHRRPADSAARRRGDGGLGSARRPGPVRPGTVLHVTLGPDDPADMGADVIALTPATCRA